MPGSARSDGGLSSRHERLPFAESEQTAANCDSQSVLPSADLSTYVSCDWLSSENLTNETRPNDSAANTTNPGQPKEDFEMQDVDNVMH